MASLDISDKTREKVNDITEHERTRLLLDTTPLACRLMKRSGDGTFELFECNEESVKLFGFRSKQEFMERYFETYPDLQPNGKSSLEEGQKHFEEAYAGGKCVIDFNYQTIDGELVPAEVTLVKVKYGEEYVIAGYTRDLRENRRLMHEVESQNKLLNMGNLAVQTLLSNEYDTDIENALLESLKLVGRAVDGDRVQIWRNEVIDGSLHFTHAYEWLSDVGKQKVPVPIGLHFPYSTVPGWKGFFSGGGYINGRLSELSEEERAFLEVYDIKTIVMIPLFLRNEFWGFFSINICVVDREFTTDEITILRSVSHMLINALNRNAQAAEIRESHDRVKVLLDKMPFACHLWNSDFKMIDCNDESARLLKLPDRNALAEHFSDFTPKYQPDGQLSEEAAHAYVQKAFDEGNYVCDEFIHIASDGTLIPAEVTLVRIPFENGFAVAAYLRDLREQKEMMKEIDKKSNLLSSMSKAANLLLQSEISEYDNNLHCSMGMIGESVNADRMCIWKNSVHEGALYCTQICEWVKEEQLRTAGEIKIDVPYEGNITSWQSVLSRGDCINTLAGDMSPDEQVRMRMHGIKSVFAAPVFVHGEFWGFVSCDNCRNENTFSDDVAATMHAGSLLIANALLRNEMTLNLQIAAADLEAALMETQKANNAKSDFLANMSHEMRTPLNAIIGLSGLSMENDTLDEDTSSNLERIYNAGDMLLSIVNDILDISKIEAGKMALVEVDYDIPSLINDTVTQNLMRIGEKPVELELDIGVDVFARLNGDELRVKQIINNLLSNAVKYTDKGVVELGVFCERQGDRVWVTIKVSDTGKGIRQEDMNNLFMDYSQLDLESNRKAEGTGLGLPISKSLVEMMGGTIGVESEYGKGSVFTVRIAQGFVSDVHIGPEVVSSLKNFRYSDDKRGRSAHITRISLPYARVLVVDDNITNLEVAKGLLKPYGMQVDCVTGGQQAVDAIRDENVRYNAIFMDHMMPEMDGIEALQIIRGQIGSEYAKSIPIIALTANALAGNEAMFLSKGFQAFIPKPIEIVRLDAIIRRWIRDKTMETDSQEHLIQEEKEKPQRLFEKVEIPGLDISGGVYRFGNDEETYLNVLRSYAENTAAVLDKIRSVDEDDLSEYAVVVHGLKGSSRGICAETAGDLAEQLEKAAKAKDYEYVRDNNDRVIECVMGLICGINEFINRLDVSRVKPEMEKIDKELIRRLINACESFNMDDVDEVMAEIAGFRYRDDGDLVKWLSESINQTNFKEIVERLSAAE